MNIYGEARNINKSCQHWCPLWNRWINGVTSSPKYQINHRNQFLCSELILSRKLFFLLKENNLYIMNSCKFLNDWVNERQSQWQLIFFFLSFWVCFILVKMNTFTLIKHFFLVMHLIIASLCYKRRPMWVKSTFLPWVQWFFILLCVSSVYNLKVRYRVTEG